MEDEVDFVTCREVGTEVEIDEEEMHVEHGDDGERPHEDVVNDKVEKTVRETIHMMKNYSVEKRRNCNTFYKHSN